jgi:hypothetical protein
MPTGDLGPREEPGRPPDGASAGSDRGSRHRVSRCGSRAGRPGTPPPQLLQAERCRPSSVDGDDGRRRRRTPALRSGRDPHPRLAARMMVLAQRHEIVDGVRLAARRHRHDVMNLQPARARPVVLTLAMRATTASADVERARRVAREVAAAVPEVSEIYLVGSRLTGTSGAASDFDFIAVVSGDPRRPGWREAGRTPAPGYPAMCGDAPAHWCLLSAADFSREDIERAASPARPVELLHERARSVPTPVPTSDRKNVD